MGFKYLYALVQGKIETGNPWKPMETHGNPWKPMETLIFHGNTMGI
jgi:hypothetical protein